MLIITATPTSINLIISTIPGDFDCLHLFYFKFFCSLITLILQVIFKICFLISSYIVAITQNVCGTEWMAFMWQLLTHSHLF